MTGPTKREVRDLVTRAVRLAADEVGITSFSPPEPHVEKALAEDYDFLYYLIWLTKMDEREACAKVCDDLWQEDKTAHDCREAIRARSNTNS